MTGQLAELVDALTRCMQGLPCIDRWKPVDDAVERIRKAGVSDPAVQELLDVVDSRPFEWAVLDRARHELARRSGAPAGSCHASCVYSCTLRRGSQADLEEPDPT